MPVRRRRQWDMHRHVFQSASTAVWFTGTAVPLFRGKGQVPARWQRYTHPINNDRYRVHQHNICWCTYPQCTPTGTSIRTVASKWDAEQQGTVGTGTTSSCTGTEFVEQSCILYYCLVHTCLHKETKGKCRRVGAGNGNCTGMS